MSDLQRIANDIARCKERIQQMESGKRGVIPTEAMHMNAGVAFENQLQSQRNYLAQFELEFVHAKLGRGWSAADVIIAMQEWQRK